MRKKLASTRHSSLVTSSLRLYAFAAKAASRVALEVLSRKGFSAALLRGHSHDETPKPRKAFDRAAPGVCGARASPALRRARARAEGGTRNGIGVRLGRRERRRGRRGRGHVRRPFAALQDGRARTTRRGGAVP